MRQREQLQRQSRHAGFTLLEVAIVAILSAILISGLAAASMYATRSNQESATIGNPERAIHQALEIISNDLRTNTTNSPYACGRTGNITIDGMTITWRTARAAINPNGSITQLPTCGSAAEQHTLRITGTTTSTNGVRHEREAIVAISAAGAPPRIEDFTVTPNPAHLQPGDSATFNWRLTPDSPPGTRTYLNGDHVHTDPNNRTGTTTLTFTQGSSVELLAQAPSGEDSRTIGVTVGNAPIITNLAPNKTQYIPGDTITLSHTIDPQRLAITRASTRTSFDPRERPIPLPANRLNVFSGTQTITIPHNQSGPVTFTTTASNAGGTTQRTVRITECPVPTINISAPNRITREGNVNENITIIWRSNADSVTFEEIGLPPIHGLPPNSSISRRVTASPVPSTRSYTWRVTATNACGRSAVATAVTIVEATCTAPTVRVQAPSSVYRVGRPVNELITVAWSTTNATSATFRMGGPNQPSVNVPVNGSRLERVTAGSSRGSTRGPVFRPGTTSYTWTVTATNACGATSEDSARTIVEALEEDAPNNPGDGGGGGGGGGGSTPDRCIYVPGDATTACNCEDLAHEANRGTPNCIFFQGSGTLPNCNLTSVNVCTGSGGGGGTPGEFTPD